MPVKSRRRAATSRHRADGTATGRVALGAAPNRRPAQSPSGAKKAVTAAASATRSSTCASSRAECIDSSGAPTSTVRMPRRVALSGPIVDPHGIVLFETNGCGETPACRHARAHSAAPTASVA